MEELESITDSVSNLEVKPRPPVVLAIDFGTAFSGYAYSSIENPKDIKTNDYWGRQEYVSLKAPTSVLVDPDKQFAAFGYEAEKKYTELLESENDDGWSLFRKFKMKLYNTMDADNTMLNDIKGKSQLSAKKVFVMAIKYLKDHALQRLAQDGVDEDQVITVLTIPAIWNDKARRFMRVAGIEAGIDGERLLLALESEAASVYCLGIEVFADKHTMQPGQKYMVADLGGGTADITVHEITDDLKLKELHESTGGDWGGTKIDKQFTKLLEEVMGKEAMNRFRSECLYEVFDMLRNFEVTKRTNLPETSVKVTIKIPSVLREMNLDAMKVSRRDFFKTLTAPQPRFTDKVKVKGDRLKLDVDMAKGMFKVCSDNLVDHLKSHSSIDKIDVLLCVGGFSDCQLIRNALEEAFPDKNIVFPNEGGLVVLRGAVLYGHKPDIITSRVSKFTYGIRAMEPWEKEKHPIQKRKIIDGKFYCCDIFKPLVLENEEVPNGHTVVVKDLLPQDTNKIIAECALFTSTRPNVQFVTDFCCSKLGDSVKCRLPAEEDIQDRKYDVICVFEESELVVIIKHTKTGLTYKKTFNFL